MAEAYPWQDDLWHKLAGRTQHAHAYLLHGPQGIGKRALAERLMALLLCQRPAAQQACGACKSCLLLQAGSHPDNFILEPEEADKAIKSIRSANWWRSWCRRRSWVGARWC